MGNLAIDLATLQEPDSYLEWSDFAALCDRLGEMDTGVPSLRHIGREIAGRVLPNEGRSPTSQTHALYGERAASLVRTLLPGASFRTSKKSARLIELELSLAPEDTACQAFFELVAGVAECAPRVLAMKSAQVDADISGRLGRYGVTLPRAVRRPTVESHATPASDLGRELVAAGSLEEVVSLLFRTLRDELQCPAASLWLEPAEGGEAVAIRRDGEPVKPPSRTFVVGASDQAFGRIDIWDPAEPLPGYEAHLESQLPWFGIAIENLRLRESESQLRRVVDYSDAILGEVGPDGSFLQLSSRCEQILGFPSDHFLGKNFSEFLLPEDRSETLKAFGHTIEPGAATVYRFRALHRDGSIRWLESHMRVPED